VHEKATPVISISPAEQAEWLRMGADKNRMIWQQVCSMQFGYDFLHQTIFSSHYPLLVSSYY